jgi:hypothetical protein
MFYAQARIAQSLYYQTTTILFTVLHPLALILSLLYAAFYKGRQGEIELPGDEHPGLHNGTEASTPRQPTLAAQGDEENQRGPREIERDAIWG